MNRLLLLAAALAACTPAVSELRHPVDVTVAQRLGASIDRAAIDRVLSAPLDRQAAIQIALANNARLAATLDELGIAGGALGEALGLGATEIDAAYRFGDHRELEIDAVQNVLGLITSARRRAAAHAEIAAAQAEAIAATLRLAARVDIAFTDLLAARQELELRQTAFDAADAAATVRERMHAAGNASDLAQARDRDAREQARIDLGRAETAVELRREMLNGLLGLSGAQTGWNATGMLAELPAKAPSLDALEATAVRASLDLEAARARVTSTANTAADLRLRAWLPQLGVGVSFHDDVERSVGPIVRIGIPLLDWNSGGRARANASERKAAHELSATAVELRASARAARVTALASYAEARHLQTVVLPLRQQIVDETLRHYNAMDADPFALIIARRDLVEAGHQYLEALRRYANAMTQVTALERGVAVDERTNDVDHAP